MMNSIKGVSHLPVPEIEEVNLSHSFKQPRNQNARPPRLNPKHDISINRSLNSTGAQTISFRRESDSVHGTPLFSPIYNKLKEETYFEQCFEQITKIGEGSFGEVFKALSKEDGQYYAIKKSKRFLRTNGYRTERLEEVKRIEQFSQHEHCVTLYKAWEQNDCLYMQMELCKGSLEYYAMESKVIPEVMVWSCLLDLLLALKSLHDRNLIHLDIKLDNILITEEKSCKLADFGLVFDLSRKDHTRAVEGDSRYIAPELLQGQLSKSVDVFSLGIAILELSCNLELPPNGPLWQELRNDVLPDVVGKLVSTELSSIVRCMMASDPAKRPSVDTLLQYPRFQKMLIMRRRIAMLKRLKQTFQVYMRRLFAYLKLMFLTFFHFVSTSLQLKHRKAQRRHRQRRQAHPNQTLLLSGGDDDDDVSYGPDSFNSSYCEISDLDEGTNEASVTPTLNNSIPKHTPGLKIQYNSTPLNHHLDEAEQCVNFRSYRNNLSRTSLDFGAIDDDLSFSSDAASANTSANKGRSSSANLDSMANVSKKLFFRPEDSD